MKNSYALIVAINHYQEPGNDLAGCINDAMDWAKRFREVKMPAVNIRALFDNDATKLGMITALKEWHAHATPHHRVIVILDSCFSGGMSRSSEKNITKMRYMKSPRRPDSALPLRRFGIRQDDLRSTRSSPYQKHYLLSACKENQTAADAEFEGRPNGAFTWGLMRAIDECGLAGSIHDVFAQAKLAVKQQGYEQRPQLEGPGNIMGLPFFANDSLYFIYSGHGSQVEDSSEDEGEKLDEILCPYDCDLWWNDPLSDDVLAKILKS